MTTLAPPVFVENDPAKNEAVLKSLFEETLGKTLFPAQSEALLVYAIAYIQTIHKSLIQYTGEQALLSFATEERLDRFGDLWGELGKRLKASKALTTLRFTLAIEEINNRIIPLGTRVRSQDNKFIFATTAIATIPSGKLFTEVRAEATVAGAEANGYEPGQINELFDLLSNIASVENITITNSGTDREDDGAFRDRLRLAPLALSVTGTEGAYEYWVRSADTSITAVKVRSPTPLEQIAELNLKAEALAQELLDKIVTVHGGAIGTATAENLASIIKPKLGIPRYFYVRIYVLTKTGLPSSEILEKVRINLIGKTPINDEIEILAPTNVNYSVSATVTAYSDVDIKQLQSDLDKAASSKCAEIDATMGRDIVPSQFYAALQLPGVHSVILSSPNAIAIQYSERPNCTSIDISIVNITDSSN